METPLTDMTIDQMINHCADQGIDIHTYAYLIDEMFWDGHNVLEIKQQIQVLEGDCSL
jgi:hypothetical protein|tara:strand:- start:531 stop:704 length:174 start_codon:yes stop_codon:yes gene_type:complete